MIGLPSIGGVALIALCLVGCSAQVPWHMESTNSREVKSYPNSDTDSYEAVDSAEEEEIFNEEEIVHMESQDDLYEDKMALSSLISELSDGSVESVSSEPDSSAEKLATVDKIPQFEFSTVEIPTAEEIWNLSQKKCRRILKDAKIKTSEPSFKTPFVEMPLLLESPIEGVEVSAKWYKPENPTNSVMDCRLVVSLIGLCRQARKMGISKIQFYSTYRPIKEPPKKCSKGRKGKKCRAQQVAYKKARGGSMSQHRRATAIDIRWFEKNDGTVIDVFEDYERNSKHPPCDEAPKTEKGEFLKEFACVLHEQKLYNVMLTPNANKAHHNHFHFDITPDAKWYIIR